MKFPHWRRPRGGHSGAYAPGMFQKNNDVLFLLSKNSPFRLMKKKILKRHDPENFEMFSASMTIWLKQKSAYLNICVEKGNLIR